MNEARKWAAELLAPSLGHSPERLIEGVKMLAACVMEEEVGAAPVAPGKKWTPLGKRWTPERVELLRVRRGAGEEIRHILPALNALPGEAISTIQAHSYAAKVLGLRSQSNSTRSVNSRKMVAELTAARRANGTGAHA